MTLSELIAAKSPQDCPRCGNYYLTWRWDVLRQNGKDTRPVIYCDCCGAMAEPDLWNRIEPMPDRKYSREPQ